MEASALQAPQAHRFRLSLSGPLLRLRSDEQLVALFRAGSDDAFGVIHERYRPRLLAYMRQMLGGSRADAEDALQDVFLRAYGALRADGRPVSLRAWLYRVAHNRCIDHLRRPTPAPADVYDLSRAPAADPTAETERREDLRRLVADVRRLPSQQRSALLMREMEGLSYEDLATALDVTVPAVKSLLVRARMGLVQASEARDAACADVRVDLAAAHGRGVRANGRARRHLRDCAGCRDYRGVLRAQQRELAGFAPGLGPLALLAKLAGGGAAAGSGGSAAAGGAAAGGAVIGGGTLLGGGLLTASAGKVALVVAAGAVAAGGAVEVGHELERSAQPVQPKAAPSPQVIERVHRARPDPVVAALKAPPRAHAPARERPRRAAATKRRPERATERPDATSPGPRLRPDPAPVAPAAPAVEPGAASVPRDGGATAPDPLGRTPAGTGGALPGQPGTTAPGTATAQPVAPGTTVTGTKEGSSSSSAPSTTTSAPATSSSTAESTATASGSPGGAGHP